MITAAGGADEAQLRQEQAYVDRLYARLDVLRERTAAELARTRRAGGTGTPQSRSERDAFATLYENRLAQLRGVEERLCFGRLDLLDGERRYVGRIGLSDDEQRQLLVDWRAPAAQDFYRATAARPGDVVRRRHLRSSGRTVTGVEDEVLNLAALGAGEEATLQGEGVLLATLGAARTGRMSDIVATIQAEQDEVIRSELRDVLVVQGGPGTGKTAVALHRAAYLLYTHRDRLARSGVLLVGPSLVFLRYIEAVLPSLGETGVVMATPGGLFPGVEAGAVERPAVAVLKGDPRMARVIAAALRHRQRVPDGPRRLDVEGVMVTLPPERVAAARDKARRSHKPHNAARLTFVLDLLDHLADEVQRVLGSPLGEDDRAEVIGDLRAARDVRRELNLAWPPLSPEQLLADLYADPDRIAAAAPGLSAAERELLRRDRGSPWTVSDVPLLDEAAELLGSDETAAGGAARLAAEQRAADVAYARKVLASIGGPAARMVTPDALADRFAEPPAALTVADRAAADRSWAYGHVVVDEAQELSPLMWRLLMRRCPSRSMTVVGDVAQTGSPAGARSWRGVLDPLVRGRWRVAELSVNYRTPAEVMAVAAKTLAAAGVQARTPRSVRHGAWPPTAERIAAGDMAAVAAVVSAELELLAAGRLAVIGPRAQTGQLADALAAALPAGVTGRGPGALDARVGVVTVDEVKGLEFDAVVLVEPAAILGESPRGANDLYVALTRPTQRLRVLHSQPLAPGMDELSRTKPAH